MPASRLAPLSPPSPSNASVKSVLDKRRYGPPFTLSSGHSTRPKGPPPRPDLSSVFLFLHETRERGGKGGGRKKTLESHSLSSLGEFERRGRVSLGERSKRGYSKRKHHWRQLLPVIKSHAYPLVIPRIKEELTKYINKRLTEASNITPGIFAVSIQTVFSNINS